MANNTVNPYNSPNTIIITDSDQNQITVTQPITSLIEVGSVGPQGAKGDKGDTGESGSLQPSNSGSFEITGSLLISGSGTLTNIGPAIFSGSLDVTQGITGSLFGTSSYAVTASYAEYAVSASYEIIKEVSASHADFADSSSYALTASYLDNYIPPFPYTGSAEITGSLGVTGSVNISGSTNLTGSVDIYKSGSTVLDVQGSQGQLFSVVDELSGSLMSVNDISGLPILEVFSDDRVEMGTYGSPGLIVSGSSVSTNDLTISGALSLTGTGNATQETAVIQSLSGSIAIVPSGSGAITAQVPDGTTAGGNARGAYAVDFQRTRINANDGARGNRGFIGNGNSNEIGTISYGAIVNGIYNTCNAELGFIGNGESNFLSNIQNVITGGKSNTNSSAYGVISGGQSNTASTNTHATVVGGYQNSSTGQYSISGGNGNTASGQGSVALGQNNIASGTNTIALGANLTGSQDNTLYTNNAILSGSLRGINTDITPTTATASLDCSQGNFFDLTLSSSYEMYLSASNIQPGQTINLRITQPATSGSLTYGSEFKFPGGIPYEVSATGSVVDIVSFISFDSSTLYGTAIKNLS